MHARLGGWVGNTEKRPAVRCARRRRLWLPTAVAGAGRAWFRPIDREYTLPQRKEARGFGAGFSRSFGRDRFVAGVSGKGASRGSLRVARLRSPPLSSSGCGAGATVGARAPLTLQVGGILRLSKFLSFSRYEFWTDGRPRRHGRVRRHGWLRRLWRLWSCLLYTSPSPRD